MRTLPQTSQLIYYCLPNKLSDADLEGFNEAVGKVAPDAVNRCWQLLSSFSAKQTDSYYTLTFGFEALEEASGQEVFELEWLEDWITYHAVATPQELRGK